jgi:hypothetical protein
MNPRETEKVLRSIVHAALTTTPSAASGLVVALASAGRVEELRFLLESQLLPPTRSKKDAEIAHAIFPVLHACKPGERTAADNLIADWKSSFGVSNEQELSDALRTCSNASLAASLLTQGANPVFSDGWTQTPLYSSLNNEHLDVLRVLVAHCIRLDIVPTFSAEKDALNGSSDGLFQRMLQPTGSVQQQQALNTILDDTETSTLGPKCQAHVREALLRNHHLESLNPRTKSGALGAERAFRLACLAGFTAAQWMQFSNGCAEPGAVPAALADMTKYADVAQRVFEAMRDSGIDLDTLEIDLTKKKLGPLTVLQRAARADNAAVVRCLIELGADPAQTRQYEGRKVSAITLAPRAGATSQLLAAWRARSAIRDAVAGPAASHHA